MIFAINPLAAIGIVAIVLCYFLASRRLDHRPARHQLFFFWLFIVALFVSFGPLDGLASRHVFWAHMAADSLQAFLAPVFLLLSLPEWMARPLLTARRIKPVARFFSNPLIAFLTFMAFFCLAHDPPIFDVVCQSPGWHAIVHAAFVVAGTIMWWPLLSPMPEYPRLSYPVQILYLFLLLIPMTAVAAPITLSDEVLYSWYAAGPHPFGLSPMDDQILGGIVMWVGVAILMITAATLIFFRWARNEEIEEPPVNLRRPADLRLVERRGGARA